MATIYWEGKADAVAQVESGSIDSVDGTPSNNTFTVTIGGDTVSVTGDTDAATTAAALVVALNASTHPYFAAITWTNPSGGTVTGTADTAGVPFTAALSVSGAGTGSVTDFSTSTASSGPNDWSTAANWSGGAVPVAADDVVIDGSVNICWGLAQSAVDLDTLVIRQTYTGKIGLRYDAFATSADGDTVSPSKPEYRAHYLDIESDEVDIGFHAGPGTPTGSGRIKLDLGVHASTVTIHNTARTPNETGGYAVNLLAASASTKVYVRAAPGGVGIAMNEPHETTTVSLVSISDPSTDTVVATGEGVTVTTWEQAGGENALQAGATVTTATVDGGTLDVDGAFTITTLNVNGGTVYANNVPAAGAALGTSNVNGGALVGTRSTEARTWTTVNLYAGSSVEVDKDVVTLTNGITLAEGPLRVSA